MVRQKHRSLTANAMSPTNATFSIVSSSRRQLRQLRMPRLRTLPITPTSPMEGMIKPLMQSSTASVMVASLVTLTFMIPLKVELSTKGPVVTYRKNPAGSLEISNCFKTAEKYVYQKFLVLDSIQQMLVYKFLFLVPIQFLSLPNSSTDCKLLSLVGNIRNFATIRLHFKNCSILLKINVKHRSHNHTTAQCFLFFRRSKVAS